MSKKTAKPNPAPPPEEEDTSEVDYDDLDLNLDDLFSDDDEDDPPVVVEEVQDGPPAKAAGKGSKKRVPAVEVEPLGNGPKPKGPLTVADSDDLAMLPPLLDRLNALEETLVAAVTAVEARLGSMESKLILQSENVHKAIKAADASIHSKLEQLDKFLSSEFGYDDNHDNTILQDIAEAVGAGEVKAAVATKAEAPKNGSTKKDTSQVLDEVKHKLLRIINKQPKPLAWAGAVPGLANHLKITEKEVEAALVSCGYEKGQKLEPGKITG